MLHEVQARVLECLEEVLVSQSLAHRVREVAATRFAEKKASTGAGTDEPPGPLLERKLREWPEAPTPQHLEKVLRALLVVVPPELTPLQPFVQELQPPLRLTRNRPLVVHVLLRSLMHTVPFLVFVRPQPPQLLARLMDSSTHPTRLFQPHSVRLWEAVRPTRAAHLLPTV